MSGQLPGRLAGEPERSIRLPCGAFRSLPPDLPALVAVGVISYANPPWLVQSNPHPSQIACA
jgi:hypothetical protein